jgi:hypothetical protein
MNLVSRKNILTLSCSMALVIAMKLG